MSRCQQALAIALVVAVILLGACEPASAAPEQSPSPGPPADLKQAIADGVRLLHGKEYAAFLKRFVHPDDWKQVLGQRTEQELAREFDEGGKAVELLAVLEYVQRCSPVLSAGGEKAAYSLVDMPEAPTHLPLVFQKTGGRWYLRN